MQKMFIKNHVQEQSLPNIRPKHLSFVTTESTRLPSPRLSISRAKKNTHLPAKASFGEIPQDLVKILVFQNERKIFPRCLPSGNACSQNFAPRHNGMSKIPLIFVISILRIARKIKAIGGAQKTTSFSQECAKASTPAHVLVYEKE
jgi:hypothetical protein